MHTFSIHTTAQSKCSHSKKGRTRGITRKDQIKARLNTSTANTKSYGSMSCIWDSDRIIWAHIGLCSLTFSVLLPTAPSPFSLVHAAFLRRGSSTSRELPCSLCLPFLDSHGSLSGPHFRDADPAIHWQALEAL